MKLKLLSFVPAALFAVSTAMAQVGEADVVAATAERQADGSYRFDVTIRSNDTGWDYYADAFEILTPDGDLLGRRELLHPHETEQPFTRSLSGVMVPDDVSRVVVRARHKPAGYDGKTVTLELPR